MSDGFKVTGPGFYKQRDGRKAEVLAVRGEKAYGIAQNNEATYWRISGRWICDDDPDEDWDLIAPWPAAPALEWTTKSNDTWKAGRHEIYFAGGSHGLFAYGGSLYPTLAAAKRAAETLEAERVAKEKAKEPIPDGVWYNAANDSFHGKSSSMTGTVNFWDKWYDRRAEFPHSPPPPATPWTQADVPDNAWYDLGTAGEGLLWPVSQTETGLRFYGEVTEWSYGQLKTYAKWTVKGSPLAPCTREAVAAWRNGGAK